MPASNPRRPKPFITFLQFIEPTFSNLRALNLVLVEVGLGELGVYPDANDYVVLILVLVEDGLGAETSKIGGVDRTLS